MYLSVKLCYNQASIFYHSRVVYLLVKLCYNQASIFYHSRVVYLLNKGTKLETVLEYGPKNQTNV